MELDSGVLILIKDIVKRHPLKGADAVHLASALWLRDMVKAGRGLGQYDEAIIFVSSDKQLISAAHKYNLEIFNPQTAR